MNYVYLLLEVILVFLLMVLFYRFGKKDGLFTYIGFMSVVVGTIMFKSIDILSFEVNLGIPIVMAIFVCSNIIIQRYGIDEIKKIIRCFIIPYLLTIIILSLSSLIGSSEYNLTANNAFNSLFGYNLDNIRLIVGGILSIGFMLWYNAYIYYYIRKSKNKYLFSNIGSMLIIQFIESIIFVLITFVGSFDINTLFGMIVIRYLLKIVLGVISLLPVSIILKMKI